MASDAAKTGGNIPQLSTEILYLSRWIVKLHKFGCVEVYNGGAILFAYSKIGLFRNAT